MPHEPKKKHSKAAKRTRRAALALGALSLIACKNCGAQIISHTTCPSCGFYGGAEVKKTKTAVTVTKA